MTFHVDGAAPPEGSDWLVGEGLALGMIDRALPTEHRSEAWIRLGSDESYD